jgi:hypothetical protein
VSQAKQQQQQRQIELQQQQLQQEREQGAALDAALAGAQLARAAQADHVKRLNRRVGALTIQLNRARSQHLMQQQISKEPVALCTQLLQGLRGGPGLGGAYTCVTAAIVAEAFLDANCSMRGLRKALAGGVGLLQQEPLSSQVRQGAPEAAGGGSSSRARAVAGARRTRSSGTRTRQQPGQQGELGRGESSRKDS